MVEVYDIIEMFFFKLRQQGRKAVIHEVNLVYVWVVDKDLVVFLLGEVMYFSERELRLETPDDRGSKDDISYRAESDYKNLVHGFVFCSRAKIGKMGVLGGVFFLYNVTFLVYKVISLVYNVTFLVYIISELLYTITFLLYIINAVLYGLSFLLYELTLLLYEIVCGFFEGENYTGI